jgi:hypothetical protein
MVTMLYSSMTKFLSILIFSFIFINLSHAQDDDPVGECMDLILADKRVNISMAYVAKACRNATKSTPACMRRVFNSDGHRLYMNYIATDYCSPKVKE